MVWKLLGVSGTGNKFVVVCGDTKIAEYFIGDILNLEPLHGKDAFPAGGLYPNVAFFGVIYRAQHSSDATELTRTIHQEE